jgi:hypothetical protein
MTCLVHVSLHTIVNFYNLSEILPHGVYSNLDCLVRLTSKNDMEDGKGVVARLTGKTQYILNFALVEK